MDPKQEKYYLAQTTKKINKSIIALQYALLLFPVAIIVVVGCYERYTIISSAYTRYLLCINNVDDNGETHVANATPILCR